MPTFQRNSSLSPEAPPASDPASAAVSAQAAGAASDGYLSMHAAAAAAGTTRYSLMRWAAKGAIQPLQFGGRLWFRTEDVEKLAEQLAATKRR